ncbi:MAG: ABC transporter substrate-binding protein [Deltaproteobacteria bacterium]|jgi:iron complex transport system substrate-binding protein|nr:ABC transporter substrate-binding protein [Deltaproteobacteria bacterium]
MYLVAYPAPSKGEEKEYITVEDSLKRRIIVPKNPQKIVALTATSAEVLRLLGYIDRVVGTTIFVKTREDIIPEVKDMTNVGRGFVPNLEIIAKLNPDLVIAWSDNPGPELEGQLKVLGIGLLRLDFILPWELERETLILAEVMGGQAPERAKEFLSWNKNLENRLQNLILEKPKPTVLVEHYSERLLIAGNQSASYYTTVMAGGDNLAKNIDRKSAEVDSEWVVRENPEFIIKLVMFLSLEERRSPKDLMEYLRSDVLNRPGWEDVKAIKDRRVYVLDADTSGGPRNFTSIYQVAHWFYPDLVREDEVEKLEKEYFERFQGFASWP